MTTSSPNQYTVTGPQDDEKPPEQCEYLDHVALMLEDDPNLAVGLWLPPINIPCLTPAWRWLFRPPESIHGY